MLAGLPPLVREGDRFAAMLTLRNTTTREMKVRATLQGTANLPRRGRRRDRAPADRACRRRTSSSAPAQAKEVVWPVDVPADAFSITWEASADGRGREGPDAR